MSGHVVGGSSVLTRSGLTTRDCGLTRSLTHMPAGSFSSFGKLLADGEVYACTYSLLAHRTNMSSGPSSTSQLMFPAAASCCMMALSFSACWRVLFDFIAP